MRNIFTQISAKKEQFKDVQRIKLSNVSMYYFLYWVYVKNNHNLLMILQSVLNFSSGSFLYHHPFHPLPPTPVNSSEFCQILSAETPFQDKKLKLKH